MTDTHDCHYHRTPSRSCYIGHGCRCPRCSWHEARYYAARHGRPEPAPPVTSVSVPLPVDLWLRLERMAFGRGVTFDQLLETVAQEVAA